MAHVVFAVFEPATLPEALGLLANEGDASAALAGGTDLLLRIRRGVRKYRSVVNIKFVPGLTGLTWDAQRGLTLGALTTFRTIEQNEHVRRHYLALVEAARVVAGVQLRNLATIGGNIGNASPSADSVPPLWRSEPPSRSHPPPEHAWCRSRRASPVPAARF